MPDYTDRDKPGLGALSDILKSAANMYTHILPEYRQKYAEFQEEKRKAAQGQSNWQAGQKATADYRQGMLGQSQNRLAETGRHNRAMEPKPGEPAADKPLNESQWKAQFLANLPPEKQEEYVLGKKPEQPKPVTSTTNQLLDWFKDSRWTPETSPGAGDGFFPPFTSGTADTVNTILSTGKFPQSPSPQMQWNDGGVNSMLGDAPQQGDSAEKTRKLQMLNEDYEAGRINDSTFQQWRNKILIGEY